MGRNVVKIPLNFSNDFKYLSLLILPNIKRKSFKNHRGEIGYNPGRKKHPCLTF
jgi:hypothetical protein